MWPLQVSDHAVRVGQRTHRLYVFDEHSIPKLPRLVRGGVHLRHFGILNKL
jgi:hypothetical protein